MDCPAERRFLGIVALGACHNAGLQIFQTVNPDLVVTTMVRHASLCHAVGIYVTENFALRLFRPFWQTSIRHSPAIRLGGRKTMLVVTTDEHGGFFDHVPPISIPAKINETVIETTGVRVPAFIVSPYIAPRQVFHGPLDRTSLLQLLDDRL
jgi:Phosphoesterase family